MTLILTNSSLAHIEESKSFLDCIVASQNKAEIYITDNGIHDVGKFNITKIFNNINAYKVFNILQKIKKQKVSKIIITAPIPLSLFVVFFLQKKQVEVMYILHEPFMKQNNLYSFLVNAFHKYFLKYVDTLLFYSAYSKEQFINEDNDFKGDIFTIPLYKYRKKIKQPLSYDEKIYISFIGNMGQNKNLSYIIEIAKKLPKENFLIAGYGNMEQYKADLIDSKNIKIINRFLTEDEYFTYIDKSKIVLLPYSSTSQSGVLLDVMCRGTIPIGTKTGAFSEIIHQGINGYIFSYDTYCDDFIALYDKLTEKNIYMISVESLAFYNKNMSLEAFNEAFMRIYLR